VPIFVSEAIVLIYSQQHEGFTAPVDGRSTIGEFDPRFHNFSGPIRTTLPALLNPSIDARVLVASDQLKGEFTFNLDMNSGTPLGTGLFRFLCWTIGHVFNVRSRLAAIDHGTGRAQ